MPKHLKSESRDFSLPSLAKYNGANVVKNSTTDSPFIKFEKIQIYELIPKEQYSATLDGLKKFYQTEKSSNCFNNVRKPDMTTEKVNKRQSFENNYLWELLYSFEVSEKSLLHEYISHIGIFASSISSSFIVLNFSVTINYKLSEEVSEYLTTHKENEPFLIGFDEHPWHGFKRLQLRKIPVCREKYDNIRKLTQEIKFLLLSGYPFDSGQ